MNKYSQYPTYSPEVQAKADELTKKIQALTQELERLSQQKAVIPPPPWGLVFDDYVDFCLDNWDSGYSYNDAIEAIAQAFGPAMRQWLIAQNKGVMSERMAFVYHGSPWKESVDKLMKFYH